jgi:hypothetical protein
MTKWSEWKKGGWSKSLCSLLIATLSNDAGLPVNLVLNILIGEIKRLIYQLSNELLGLKNCNKLNGFGNG